MKRKRVNVEMAGLLGRLPNCLEQDCPLGGECANHDTAGIFRGSTGMTPDLRRSLWRGRWMCTRQDTGRYHGSVTLDYPDGR
jgi:hypothetical protein